MCDAFPVVCLNTFLEVVPACAQWQIGVPGLTGSTSLVETVVTLGGDISKACTVDFSPWRMFLPDGNAHLANSCVAIPADGGDVFGGERKIALFD